MLPPRIFFIENWISSISLFLFVCECSKESFHFEHSVYLYVIYFHLDEPLFLCHEQWHFIIEENIMNSHSTNHLNTYERHYCCSSLRKKKKIAFIPFFLEYSHTQMKLAHSTIESVAYCSARCTEMCAQNYKINGKCFVCEQKMGSNCDWCY